jgi:hypothetical protein
MTLGPAGQSAGPPDAFQPLDQILALYITQCCPEYPTSVDIVALLRVLNTSRRSPSWVQRRMRAPEAHQRKIITGARWMSC